MYSYRFIGDSERVFGHLQHGVNATVEHDPRLEPFPEELADGETVLLRPGDTLLVEQLETHAELEPADAATADAHAAALEAAAPERLPRKKAELQELARTRGLDDTGTVDDLTARLTEPQE